LTPGEELPPGIEPNQGKTPGVSIIVNDGSTLKTLHLHKPIGYHNLGEEAWIMSRSRELGELKANRDDPNQQQRQLAKNAYVAKSLSGIRDLELTRTLMEELRPDLELLIRGPITDSTRVYVNFVSDPGVRFDMVLQSTSGIDLHELEQTHDYVPQKRTYNLVGIESLAQKASNYQVIDSLDAMQLNEEARVRAEDKYYKSNYYQELVKKNPDKEYFPPALKPIVSRMEAFPNWQIEGAVSRVFKTFANPHRDLWKLENPVNHVTRDESGREQVDTHVRGTAKQAGIAIRQFLQVLKVPQIGGQAQILFQEQEEEDDENDLTDVMEVLPTEDQTMVKSEAEPTDLSGVSTEQLANELKRRLLNEAEPEVGNSLSAAVDRWFPEGADTTGLTATLDFCCKYLFKNPDFGDIEQSLSFYLIRKYAGKFSKGFERFRKQDWLENQDLVGLGTVLKKKTKLFKPP